MPKSSKRKLTNEQKILMNPFQLNNHFMSFADYINQAFAFSLSEDGKPLLVPGEKVLFVDPTGQAHKNDKYKLKRTVELWMLCVTFIINRSLANAAAAGKSQDSFIWYGSYKEIVNYILNCVDVRLRPQLSRSITLSTVSTAMKRAAESGFISIKYDYQVTYQKRRSGEISKDQHRRAITVNYDKIIELSDINLDKKYQRKHNKTWTKYHRCSREHKWISKRLISSMLPLLADLNDKAKKADFIAKLKKLKLKYKNHQDIFKAYIIMNQSDIFSFNSSLHKKLTSIKSNCEEQNRMYNPPPLENVLTEEQEKVLKDFYAKIK